MMKHPYLDLDALVGGVNAKIAAEKLLQEMSGRSAITRELEKLNQPRLGLENYISQHFGAAANIQSTIDKLMGRSDVDEYKRLIEQQRVAAFELHKTVTTGFAKQVFEDYSQQLSNNLLKNITAPLAKTESLASRLLIQEASTFRAEIDRLTQSVSSSLQIRERELLAQFQGMLGDANLESVRITESGEVEISGIPVQLPDIDWDLERTVVSDDQPASALLEYLLGWLSTLSPLVKAALLYVLLPYIISIIANINTPLHEEWWKSVRGNTGRQAKKELRAKAAEVFPDADLSSFRFVSTRELVVHKSNKIQSPKIDYLPVGKSVRLLQKADAWSYVEYSRGIERTIVQGWVLSRYLHKFQ
jgi:hypothetical protein